MANYFSQSNYIDEFSIARSAIMFLKNVKEWFHKGKSSLFVHVSEDDNDGQFSFKDKKQKSKL